LVIPGKLLSTLEFYRDSKFLFVRSLVTCFKHSIFFLYRLIFCPNTLTFFALTRHLLTAWNSYLLSFVFLGVSSKFSSTLGGVPSLARTTEVEQEGSPISCQGLFLAQDNTFN